MTKHSWVGMGIVGTFFLLRAPMAYGQSDAPAGGEVPSQAAAPVEAAPAGASVEAVPVPPPPSQRADTSTGNCRLGAHAGFNLNDARTAASLVCRELPAEAASSGNTYRVDLDKLGTRAFLTLTAESSGNMVGSRRVTLDRIEDVPTVAPRLVEALLHNRSLKDTERSDNLTTADARTPVRRDGKMQVGGGVLGAFAPGLATVSPGLELALRYDTPHWVLGGQLRFAWGVGDGDKFNMVQFGVGPRYVLSTADTSLFVGGGMAVQRLGERKESTDAAGVSDSDSAGGVGVYAEVGVEVMRLHHKRLNVALRTDFPTFKVSDDYLVPISLTTSFMFD